MIKTGFNYEEADKYVVVNDNDPDLRPIVLSLPKPPPLHLIDKYLSVSYFTFHNSSISSSTSLK